MAATRPTLWFQLDSKKASNGQPNELLKKFGSRESPQRDDHDVVGSEEYVLLGHGHDIDILPHHCVPPFMVCDRNSQNIHDQRPLPNELVLLDRKHIIGGIPGDQDG